MNTYFKEININRLLVHSIFLVLFLIGAAQGIFWYCQLTQSSDLDYAESWHAYCALQAIARDSPINGLGQSPYNVLPYPPLSYIVNALLGYFFSGDLQGIRGVGRLVSVVSTLFSATLLVLIAKRLQIGLVWAFFSALLFLVSSDIHMFAVSLRPDELACCLTLVAVYICLKNQSFLAVGVFFALALLAKTSYVTCPVVLGLILLRQRQYRDVLYLSTAALCTVGAIFLVAFGVYGRSCWQGLTLQTLFGADPKQAIYFLAVSLERGDSIPLILGVACLFLPQLPVKIRIVAICFFLSFMINGIGLAKPGAASNYLLEPLALGSILTAWIVQHFSSIHWMEMRRVVLVAMLMLLLSSFVHITISTIHTLRSTNQKFLDRSELVKLLRRSEGPILTDTAHLYFASGHTPWCVPLDLVTTAVLKRAIDDTLLQEQLRIGFFKTIVVQANWKQRRFFFPKNWISIIEENYQVFDTVDGFLVFVPKTKAI